MPTNKPTNEPVQPTHRAILVTGETVDYAGGAHLTHWTFGGVDAEGKPDGSPVRIVPVASIVPLESFPEYYEGDGEEE
jgi:hypothetical protein